MGSIKRKSVTRPLPDGAEIVQRRRAATKQELRLNPAQRYVSEEVAKYRNKSGEKCIAAIVRRLDGSLAMRCKSETYYAKYRDADGIVREIPTGCREIETARARLAELVKEAERVKVGVVSTSELSTANAMQTTIEQHVDGYIEHLRHQKGKGKRERISASHLVNTERSIRRIVAECKIVSLRTVSRETIQRWVSDCLNDADLAWSNRSINAHVEGLKALCTWCVDTKRLTKNPLIRFPMLDTENSQVRPRRALTPAELGRLLTVARLRPIAEHGREILKKNADNQPSNKRSRATWTRAQITFETIEAAYDRGRSVLSESPVRLQELERLGKERELLYLVLVTTGLRQGELKSITIGQTYLDGEQSWIELSYADEKAGRGASVPLRDDVANRLRNHLSERLEQLENDSHTSNSIPMKGRPVQLPLDAPLFTVPDKLVRILNRDLEAAGIAKVDERGESIDVHALRHTFSTMLHRAGVTPSVAQAAMRHSDIRLTMKTYNHLGMMDVAGAVASMPAIEATNPMPDVFRATGTIDESLICAVAPTVAPDTDFQSQNLSISGNLGRLRSETPETKKPSFLKEKQGFLIVGVIGFEPTTPWSQTRCASQTALHSDEKRF